MKKIRFKAIIFDLDGTLLDTLKDLANSMNAVLIAHEMNPFPVDNYRAFVGKGLRELIKCVIPADKVNDRILDEFLASMRVKYGNHWADNTRPYPGIPGWQTRWHRPDSTGCLDR